MVQLNKTVHSNSSEESFTFFWETIILPTILAAEEDAEEEFKDSCNLQFACSNIDEYKSELQKFYRDKRQWLKGVYLPHDEHPILDIHKISAILCRSMLAYKPFYFDFNTAEEYVVKKFSGNKGNHIDWFVSNIYINYKVAFYASVGLIYAEILDSYSPNGAKADAEAFQYFMDLGGLIFYKKSPTHDNYENSCIIALQKNDVLNRKFDYLTYAINMFQLEEFNRMYYQLQIKAKQ